MEVIEAMSINIWYLKFPIDRTNRHDRISIRIKSRSVGETIWTIILTYLLCLYCKIHLYLNLKIKEHLWCVIFICKSIIITNEAIIARLVAPTIENTFTHFSLTDLKWWPDVPFNQQVCSVSFWICPISPANPHLVSKKGGGDIDIDMDRQCHTTYTCTA